MSCGYHAHTTGTGLGLDLDSMLQHIRSLEKKRAAHELDMAPLFNETFALQTAAMQAQQQVALQQTQLEQRGEQSSQLMEYLPWALGGLGVLGAAVLVIRATKKRRRNPLASSKPRIKGTPTTFLIVGVVLGGFIYAGRKK